MPAQGRKYILPDPINTPGIYLLLFVQNSLIQTNLLLQQHVTDTKPGLHDRQQVFKAVDGPSKKTQESEKEAEACRNIKLIRQLNPFIFGISSIPPPLALPPITENEDGNSWYQDTAPFPSLGSRRLTGIWVCHRELT